MARRPPVPPANRRDKGPGSSPSDKPSDVAEASDPRRSEPEKPETQGQTAATHQALRYQGHRRTR